MLTVVRLIVRPFPHLAAFTAILLLATFSFAAEIPTSPVQPVLIEGGSGLIPIDINDHGEVVGGYKFSPVETHGFFWSPTRGFVDLGALDPGGHSSAKAINNCGEIVGGAIDAEGTFESLKTVRWSAALAIEDITPLTGQIALRDINDHGNIAGQFGSSGYFWSESTGLVDIGGIGGIYTDTMKLNNRNQIAGSAQHPTTFLNHAIRWSPEDGMEDLNPIEVQTSEGLSIDEKGNVAGAYYTPVTAALHAVLFRRNGNLVDLNPMGLADVDHFSAALDIDGNYVVGLMMFPNVITTRAFVRKGNKVQLLSMNGYEDEILETRANAVNRRGQVVGTVTFLNGPTLGVIWNLNNKTVDSHDDEDAGNPRCRKRE